MPVALFGIENDGLNLAVNLLVLFLVVVYVALIAWTYFDARRRMEDPVLVACATAASLFPFAGSIVYSILRPPEFIEDKRERELEIRAADLRLRQLRDQSCPHCEFPVECTYLRCPNCKARIKDPCESCAKPIDPRWSLCPYCETPVRQAPASSPASAPAPRRKPRTAEQPAASTKAETPRKRTRKAPAARSAGSARGDGSTRQTRSPRTATQRSTAAKERKSGRSTGATPGEDEPRPAPAS